MTTKHETALHEISWLLHLFEAASPEGCDASVTRAREIANKALGTSSEESEDCSCEQALGLKRELEEQAAQFERVRVKDIAYVDERDEYYYGLVSKRLARLGRVRVKDIAYVDGRDEYYYELVNKRLERIDRRLEYLEGGEG